ncbi:MAG: SpoIIE family protein phosphatase [Bacilli bacterium]|jgi:sigma-B regulation protein RsbU (phosphoserine phosphatase)|nr:SpoIIE family protein phosphatase [Bacilli bacterium]
MDYQAWREMIISLIGTIAVIDLVAVVLNGMHHISKIRGDNNKWVKYVFLGIVGGLFGIYATISGYKMPETGATVSIRDVGPMMAGILGGPLAGLIAGLVAGLHRLLYGLPDVTIGTSIPCSISTFLIGTLAGLGSKAFSKSKRRTFEAFLIGGIMEVLHLLIVFIYECLVFTPEKGWALVAGIALPFVLCNAIGFGLMVYVLDMIDKYRLTESHAKQVESELNVANSIQSSMLPHIFPYFPGRKEFSLFASMNPAKEVGGDFYDFFFVDENHFAFLIADVSGKGVPAALFMVIAKTLIKNNLQSGLSLAEAMNKTNQELLEGNEQHMFVTAWVGVLEISTLKLTFVNCGHNPPLLALHGKPIEFLRNLSGFILAGSKKTKYKEYTLNLQPEDKLFLYTDGVTEAMNKSEEQYGEKRLLELLNQTDPTTPPDKFISHVLDDLKGFTKDAEQSDDITMVALKLNDFYVTKNFEAKNENFETISAYMEETLKEKGVGATIITKMDIVLDEIFSNICKYSGSKDVDFGLLVIGGKLKMKFTYGGDFFDITKVKEPDFTLPLKERGEGGLGLYMVKKMCDEVKYETDGTHNIVTIAKTFAN